MTENSQQLPSETRNTLLSRSPLGQKFLQPIGTRSISVLDRSLFSDKGGERQQFSDEDSPFLVKSKPGLKHEAEIQEKSVSSININPYKVTEFNSEQTRNLESNLSHNPSNFNPKIDRFTSEKSQISREFNSPLEEKSESQKDYEASPEKPESLNLSPSKSTLFREILGDSPSRKPNSPPQAENKPNFNSNSEQNINRSSFEPDPTISQRKTETYNSETPSNFSSIQLSNSGQKNSKSSNTEERSNRIDSENSSQIQRESKTQEIQNHSQKSQGSIQAKPTTNRQKSRDLVPESWSNIEELMGETEKPEPDSNREQSRLKKTPKSQLFPDSTQVGAKGEVRSSQFENQPTQIKKLMQKTLENRGKLKEKVSARKGHQIQPLNEQDLYALEENVKAQSLAQIQTLDESKEEVVTSEHLEELAREIYGAICQRFQVERERYGFNNFSNRLPW